MYEGEVAAVKPALAQVLRHREPWDPSQPPFHTTSVQVGEPR